MKMAKNNITYLTKHYYFAALFIVLVTFTSCDDDDLENNIPSSDFDRVSMLKTIAENLIIPNFEELQASVNTLSSVATEFSVNPNQVGLNNLRDAWTESVIDHQHCSAFGFGPADLLLGEYAKVLGAYPIDKDQVEANIVDSDFVLANTFDKDIRGFYTVEYLIYGSGLTDAEIISGFDQERMDFLLSIIAELKESFDGIVNEWKTDYLEDFTTNNSISTGSPMQVYYNGFVKDYENIKNFKLELPGGLSAGESPDPSLVEAFYSGISGRLIAENWENIKNIYFGRTRNGDEIIGFDQYVASVEGGSTVVTETQTAIAAIDEDVVALPPDPLSARITDQAVADLVNSLQDNTANFKANIFSLLGLEVSFNSGDGD